MYEFGLLIVLMGVAIIAAYLYLKRRQQHIHVDAAGHGTAHRHEKSATDPIVDHGHDPARPDTAG